MQYTIARATPQSPVPRSTVLEQQGARWLKFGDDYFIYTPDQGVDLQRLDLGHATVRAAVRATRHAGTSSLFLVIQKGTTFERAHPDVPVLLNKGRHLVVELDSQRAARIASRRGQFTVRPIARSETIVERIRQADDAPASNAAVKSVVDAIDRSRFAQTLSDLVQFPTRHSLTAHFRNAAASMAGRLEQMGYQVSRQTFSMPGGESLNIIADRRGTAAGERSLTLVTAHLDTINHPDGSTHPADPNAPAPGADDNGTGSAGVIEIARALADKSTRNDVRFILFGGEEEGLLGSEHYVQQLAPPERQRISALVNMDMIGVVNAGTQGPTVLLEGGDPVSKPVMRALSRAAHTYTRLAVRKSFEYRDSDHVPFIDAGVPGVLTIEGSDGENQNEHSENDTPDRVSVDLAIEILRMNAAFVAEQVGV